MPKYFFNVQNLAPEIGNRGEELQNDEATWQEATIIAGDVFKEVDGTLRPGDQWELEVTDAARKALYRIHIRTEKAK